MGIAGPICPIVRASSNFLDEGGESRPVRRWVDLQSDRQRARSAVRSIDELMKRGDDRFGGLLQCRKLGQLPGQSDVDARADIGRQEKPTRGDG